MSEGYYRRGRSNAAPRLPTIEDMGPAIVMGAGLPPVTRDGVVALAGKALAPLKIADTLLAGEAAKASGYTGNVCDLCGSSRMRVAGHCMVCEDCGETTGCS